jgi:hypothetical protein
MNLNIQSKFTGEKVIKKVLAISILIVAILACMSTTMQPAPQSQQVITQVAITQVVITQIAGDNAPVAPQPTYTLYPTYTPNPTTEPQVIFVTPTLLPDWQLMQTFNGKGKETTDLFNLPTGVVRIKWNYSGSSNFVFSLKRLDNDSEEMIENAIGNTDGQTILNVGASDRYIIDVEMAEGIWQITIEFMP